MKLQRKRILVTGGGSGIGLALARRLVPANTVVIAGRDEAKLEQARSKTPALRTLRLDVTSEDEGRRPVSWLSSELGGVHLPVNAGLLRGYPLATAQAETNSLEDVQVNVVGPLRMTRLALPFSSAPKKAPFSSSPPQPRLLRYPASPCTPPPRPPCTRSPGRSERSLRAATSAAASCGVSLASRARAHVRNRGLRRVPPPPERDPRVGAWLRLACSGVSANFSRAHRAHA